MPPQRAGGRVKDGILGRLESKPTQILCVKLLVQSTSSHGLSPSSLYMRNLSLSWGRFALINIGIWYQWEDWHYWEPGLVSMGTGLALLGTGIGVTGNQDRRYWEPGFALLGTRIGVKLGTGIFVTGN